MDKMREAFEKWATGNGHSIGKYVHEFHQGEYLSEYTAFAWMAWQAAQSAAVTVVGEVVAWRWFDSMDELVISQLDPLELGINASVLEPLIVRPTTSITSAELDALRKDAEYVKTYKDCAPIPISALNYLAENWPAAYARFYQQIDAAIAGEKKAAATYAGPSSTACDDQLVAGAGEDI